MSMDEDDRDGFAAEYALGTVDTDERAQADALMLVDTGFAASVKRWERRLGELTALVAPVEPPAPLWERIKAGLTDTGQTADLHLPEVPAPPLRADTSRADAPTADIFHMRQRMQRWRGFSTITGLMAACLVGIVLVREYKPEVLPPELRPQRPVQVVTRVVEKQPISRRATVGIYNFARGRDFVRAADAMMAKEIRVNNEFYVAPVYNELIAEGAHIGCYDIGDRMHGLGVSADLDAFLGLPLSRRATEGLV